MNLRELWGKLKGVRHFQWIALAILLGVVGSLLLQDSAGTKSTVGQTDLERRLAQVLSSVAGAGRVEVIVHTGKEKSVKAAGAFGALQTEDEQEKPSGVIVVAEGAGQLQVRLDLARAVQTLLDLPASAVEVLPKEKSP